MSHIPQPETPADDELVAYLDGELAPDDCRRVEERLGSDADYREQLRELDQAWEALDTLPRATARDDFARTTIAMLTVEAERDVVQQSTRAVAAARRRQLLWAGLGAVIVVASFLAYRLLVPDPNAPLLADLPVAARIDLLTQIDDPESRTGGVEFLRQLAARPLERFAPDAAALERELARDQMLSAASVVDRRRWIAERSPDEKSALAASWRRFTNLTPSPAAQERLRALEREIATADDAAVLRQALVAYGQWLQRRSPGDRAELRGLPIDERIARIDQVIAEEGQRAVVELSDEDAWRLRTEILAIADEHRSGLVDELRRRGIDKLRQLEQNRMGVALFLVLREFRNDRTRDATRRRLIDQLSPEAQQHLASSGRGREWRNWQLWRWMQDAMQPSTGPEQLERFFAESLDYDQRERLLNLPTSEMEAELQRLYLGDQLGLRGMEWLNRLDDPPRDRRDGADRRRPSRQRDEQPN